MLDGKNSIFPADEMDSTLLEQLDCHDLHPSGPRRGEDELPSRGEARTLVGEVVAAHTTLADGLAAAVLCEVANYRNAADLSGPVDSGD